MAGHTSGGQWLKCMRSSLISSIQSPKAWCFTRGRRRPTGGTSGWITRATTISEFDRETMANLPGWVPLTRSTPAKPNGYSHGIQNQREDLSALVSFTNCRTLLDRVFLVSKEFINPPTLPNWEEVFSQLVVVTIGTTKTIYVSGQVSVDCDRNLVGAGDLKVQAMRVFQNLELALAAVAAKVSDVVKLNIYVKDYQPADAAANQRSVAAILSTRKLAGEHLAWRAIACRRRISD